MISLLVAAVIGITGGVSVAFTLGSETERTAERAEGADVLDLGIPRADLVCDDSTVLIVGEGDTATALRSQAADWEPEGAKYAATATSCETWYPKRSGEPVEYVVYLDDYDSSGDVCTDRLTEQHKGDAAITLNADNEEALQCICQLDTDELPEVGEGQAPTTVTNMFVKNYQEMLVRAGVFPDAGSISGEFDEATIRATRRVQTNAGLSPYGYVETTTWRLVQDKACPLYRN